MTGRRSRAWWSTAVSSTCARAWAPASRPSSCWEAGTAASSGSASSPGPCPTAPPCRRPARVRPRSPRARCCVRAPTTRRHVRQMAFAGMRAGGDPRPDDELRAAAVEITDALGTSDPSRLRRPDQRAVGRRRRHRPLGARRAGHQLGGLRSSRWSSAGAGGAQHRGGGRDGAHRGLHDRETSISTRDLLVGGPRSRCRTLSCLQEAGPGFFPDRPLHRPARRGVPGIQAAGSR